MIDVDILGHIFEQSITDLQRLRHRLETTEGAPTFLSASGATPRPADQNVGAPQNREPPVGQRRKQEGAIYSPAFITRYIVRQALGGVLILLVTPLELLDSEDENEA